MVEATILKRGKAAPSRDSVADRPIRLLVLASKARGLAPGQRFRFEQWAPHLEGRHCIQLDLLPFESEALTRILYKRGHVAAKAALVARDFVRRAEAVAKARDYDAVLVFREAALIGPAIYERLIARTGKPIIFDYDDSIWSTSQQMNNGIFSRLHFFGKTRTICRLAAAVTPGNGFLADYARPWNDNVTVVPTSIELADYPVIPESKEQDRFVVSWTGSTSTLAHFEHSREALERLAALVPLTVKVICNCPPGKDIAGAEMRFVPWTQQGEAQAIGDCHAGIMPLPDNEVTRGKCGLKALQTMATGRPVVISPVGMNRDLIEHGKNGYLAATADDYVETLLKLAKDPALRARTGSAGRKTVEKHYSAEAVAAKFAAVVRSVV